jgi:hypothetical protein
LIAVLVLSGYGIPQANLMPGPTEQDDNPQSDEKEQGEDSNEVAGGDEGGDGGD